MHFIKILECVFSILLHNSTADGRGRTETKLQVSGPCKKCNKILSINTILLVSKTLNSPIAANKPPPLPTPTGIVGAIDFEVKGGRCGQFVLVGLPYNYFFFLRGMQALFSSALIVQIFISYLFLLASAHLPWSVPLEAVTCKYLSYAITGYFKFYIHCVKNHNDLPFEKQLLATNTAANYITL